jgi:predicted nucleic-acid-binding protein
VFIPLLVLAELSWVLRGKWDRERVLKSIESLLQTRGVTVESPSIASRALETARKGATGFADHVIAEISCESGAGEIITFDKAFGRMPGVRRLK